MAPPPSLPRAERKAKKRKLEDSVPDLPGDTESPTEAPLDPSASVKRQKTKGQKEEKSGSVQKESDESNGEVVRKSKKERKAERKAREAKEGGKVENRGVDVEVDVKGKVEDGKRNGEEKGEATSGGEGEGKAKGEKSEKKKRQRGKKKKGTGANSEANGEQPSKAPRFIVFIGNLPFTATTTSITSHFSAVHPKSVRHLTQKDDPSKSKGCAFVEFEGYDHMKTCLKLFHHSMFDDGVSPARKINVELTAGGGGNTKDRRTKIQDKNTKLNEERIRRLQEEEKAKWQKKAGQPADENGIHPSRRARVDGA